MSRLKQRSRVDLPLPESPMMTNTSPDMMEKSASRTPTINSYADRISSLVFPERFISPITRFGSLIRCPKSFHTSSHMILAAGCFIHSIPQSIFPMAETDLNDPIRCCPLSDCGVCSNHAVAGNRHHLPICFCQMAVMEGREKRKQKKLFRIKILIH